MKQKCCAYCDKLNKITKEHVVSKSVIKKLKINQSPGYEHGQGKYTTNNSTIKDVCEECNNGPLSELDDYFIYFVKKNLPLNTSIKSNSNIELEFDFDKLSRWLLKTLYNSERKNGYEEIEKQLLYYKDCILGKENCTRPLKVFLEILYDIPSSEIQKFIEEDKKELQTKQDNLKQTKPFINMKDFDPNTPKYIIAGFITTWQYKDFKEMVQYTQKSWRDRENSPAGYLLNSFEYKTLTDAKIENIKKRTDDFYVATISIKYKNSFNNKETVVKITPTIIKEDGKFGFNPISAIREQ